MRHRSPKMLNFSGLASQAQVAENMAQKLSDLTWNSLM
jgi:hypothetical protein